MHKANWPYLHGEVHLLALVVGSLDCVSGGLHNSVVVAEGTVLLNGVEDHDVTPCALVHTVVQVDVDHDLEVVVNCPAHAVLQDGSGRGQAGAQGEDKGGSRGRTDVGVSKRSDQHFNIIELAARHCRCVARLM